MNLYNHNTLGTQAKPLIPNLEFKELHERLLRGERCEDILEKYSLESYQKHIAEPLIRKNERNN